MARRLVVPQRFYLILTAAIFIAGLVFWVSDLTSDPPPYFSGLGQSLYTDPPQYTFHARNYTLFGQSDPFNYPKFAVFENSLVSRCAYIVFALAGASLTTANLVGVIMSLGGLLFFLLGLSRQHRLWVLVAVTFCWVISDMLITHGRLPYLENGLLFAAGILFWVYSWYGDRTWGVSLCGVLIAVVMLSGKLFGVLILPALMLAIVSSSEGNRVRRVIASGVSFIVGATLLTLIMYAGRFASVAGYFGEQTYGLYGFPPGLTTPWDFVEHVVSYGYNNRLLYVNSDLLAFMVTGGFLLALFLSLQGMSFRQLPRSTILAAFWILFMVGGLMPLGYSPTRYAVALIPPIIILCFAMIDQMMSVQEFKFARWRWYARAVLGLVLWSMLLNLGGNLFFFNIFPAPIRGLTWLSFPLVIALVIYIPRGLQKMTGRWLRRLPLFFLVAALGYSLVGNAIMVPRHHLTLMIKGIMEGNHDLEQILGPDAVVTGPYGPTLTQNTHLKSFIHHFGVAIVDSTLFDRYPITHIAVDVSNAAVATKNYPMLTKSLPLAAYWISDNKVQVYNISKVCNNPIALRYKETDFELAQQAFTQQKFDTALVLVERFLTRAPDSKQAGVLYSKILSGYGQTAKALQALITLAKRYPTDYSMQLEVGYFAAQIGVKTDDDSKKRLAQQYFRLAAMANPYRADFVNTLWEQTLNAGTGAASE